MTLEAALRIARRRMHAQHLAGPRLASPAEAVGWLGAAQSQEYGLAKWSLGRRADGVSDADVERDFAAGAILRTHVLRPTWHFVLPADIRWMLQLTGPRVLAKSTHYYRKLGLDDASLEKSTRMIERALRGGNHLMRKELRPLLAKAGIEVDSVRLSFIIMNAELRGVVCSGARRGKQHTYALLEERAANARELSADQALAELTLRYFRSHGPATLKDFAWWSSLKMADLKKGLEIVRSQLIEEAVEGASYWFVGPSSFPETRSPNVSLLQLYDEYVVAYPDSRHVIDAAGLARSYGDAFSFAGPVMVDGQWAGRWKPSLGKNEVLVEVALYEALDEAETGALHAAVSEYGDFVGLRASIETSLVR